MQTPPDVSALKARLRRDKEEAAPAPPEPVQDERLRPETRKQISDFRNDQAALEEEPEVEKVDLGELPEGIELPDDELSSVIYRGTAADNPRVRAAIEQRCPAMDFADLVINGRVIQNVPILSDKLEPTLQSLISTEQFWMERNMHLYADTDFAMRAWLGYARLVFALVDLNGTPYAKCIDPKTGLVDSAQFEKKFQEVMRLPEKIIELMLINLGWFMDRVERLYRHDFAQIKNG